MKSSIAFLFGLLCGVTGATHVLYWGAIIVTAIVAYHCGGR